MPRRIPRLPLLMAALLLLPACTLTADVAPLTSLQQVVALSNAQAGQSLPVKLQATVTYVRPSEGNLFLMDQGVGIYVRFRKEMGLLPGDRIEISGVTASSFKPILVGESVRFLSHGKTPQPKQATFEQLIQSKWDSQFVQISGQVLSANIDTSGPYNTLKILLKVPHGTVVGVVANPGQLRVEDLVDAELRITGVAGGQFDGKMQLAGIWLEVNSWRDVEFLKRASGDLWSLPLIPMDNVIHSYRYGNQSQRVRISGTLTYFEPGAVAVVEQQGRSMLVKTNSFAPLHAGQGVEATGYPAIDGESIGLENAQLRPVSQPTATPPQAANWEDASLGAHTYDLVSMEGEVVGVLHDPRVDLFIILSEGHLFSATLRHSSADALSQVGSGVSPTVGSKIRATGVCFVEPGNHWRDRLWFDLRMRSLSDIVVLQQPSWWTVKRLAYIATGLCVVILVSALWVGMLDRRLRRQTAILARQNEEDAIRQRRLARQEQQRSHILELISSSQPLSEVLQEIESMVSSRLLGSPCWFELNASAGGSDSLERPSGPAIVFQELFSKEGEPRGFLLAAPPLHGSFDQEISAALVTGARLAELAIETRRLYGDLRHRSEFDLLTDIPNRFSMERKLEQLMQSARTNQGVFGLIYVDLDRFKQVNDRYGHRVGDAYLQQVAQRMKQQLRGSDMLARIGGDEFVALVPILRTRADAEEIAMRLERCFDLPFSVEGHMLTGSASVGLAVYPEDGTTKEDLQRWADSAMYANKETRKLREKLAECVERAER